MELSLTEQAKNLIEKSSNILLVAHAKMDGDTLSSAIAMHLLLQKLDKKTTVACADAVPEIYSFLPQTKVMTREVEGGNNFVISLDCSEKKVKKLHWKMEGDQLKIILSPEQAPFVAENISFGEQSNFDLIISLDAADREQLGSIFEENTELFSSVPVIVFDHHASNPGFGNINIIDTKAASTTEVLFHFLPVLLGEEWKKKVDPDIATLLLTGIITDTGSFQNPNTTPRSLEVAADLADLGARQQEIIRNIFKTKNIETLKLWGRVLSKIKSDPIHRLLWSTVSKDDLLDTGANTEDLDGIVDELLATAPGMEMVLLIKEREDGVISTSVRTTTPLCDAAEFAGHFGGGGHTQAGGFKIRGLKPFEVVVGEIISESQKFQKERLQIATPEEGIAKEKKKEAPEESPLEKTTSVDILGTIQGKEKESENESPLEISPEEPLLSPHILNEENISPETTPEKENNKTKEAPVTEEISPENTETVAAPHFEEANLIPEAPHPEIEEDIESDSFEAEAEEEKKAPSDILGNIPEQKEDTPHVIPEKREEIPEKATPFPSTDILSMPKTESPPQEIPKEDISLPVDIKKETPSEGGDTPPIFEKPATEKTPEITPLKKDVLQEKEVVPAEEIISPERENQALEDSPQKEGGIQKTETPATTPPEKESPAEEADISHEEFSNMLEKMMKTNPADHIKKG